MSGRPFVLSKIEDRNQKVQDVNWKRSVQFRLLLFHLGVGDFGKCFGHLRVWVRWETKEKIQEVREVDVDLGSR